MGIGVRAFIVDGGTVTAVPWRRFEGLLCGNPREVMREHAGQRVRCALLYVELVNRRPIAIRHADYLVVTFGPDGRVDQSEWRRGGALAVQSTARVFGAVSEPVVEFGPYLASRQFNREFKWVPTEQEVDSLVGAVLKR